VIEAARNPARLIRQFGREFARAGGLLSADFLTSGLSLGEVRCLYEIGHASDLELSHLAVTLDLDLGYVSRILKRLHADKLVRKIPGQDRRVRRLALTASGRRLLARLELEADKRIIDWIEARPPGSVRRLLQGVEAFFAADAHIVMGDPLPGDIGRIVTRHAEIYQSEFGYPASFENYVLEAVTKFVAHFSPPNDYLVVVRQSQAFLGSIALKTLPDRRSQIRFLLVETSARGSGLGRRLVEAAIAHARERGCLRILLDTASDLKAARSLYASLGFRQISEFGSTWLPPGTMSETWELELV